MKVVGIVGASGSGKTTLIVALLGTLAGRGIRTATIKHTHHALALADPRPIRFTELGAREVVLAGPRRMLQFGARHDGAPDGGGDEAVQLESMLPRFAGYDLVLVEGFKFYDLPKIEIWRSALGRPPLHPDLAGVAAVAADVPPPGLRVPYLELADPEAVAAFILSLPS
jgi:molybdopterin-guanine dinucleotide biosynthesis protein B